MEILKRKFFVYILCFIVCICSFGYCALASDNRYDKTKYDDLYKYHYAVTGVHTDNGKDNIVYQQCYFNLESETEIVTYKFKNSSNDREQIGFISKTKCKGYYTDTLNIGEKYSVDTLGFEVSMSANQYMGGNVKFFDTKEHALAYLENGNTDGMISSGDVDYDSDNIYFKNFDVIVHTSNTAKNFYFDFIYEPSDYMQQHKDVAGFSIDCDYLMSLSAAGGLFKADVVSLNDDDIINETITDYPNTYRIPFFLDGNTKYDWLNALIRQYGYEMACGKEIIVDFNELEIAGFGATTLLEINNSTISFVINPYVGTDYGQKYYYTYNFLTGTGQVRSTKVDDDGTETSNNDLKTSDGHYHTEASTDAAGNVTYNYYYYPTNGVPYEVSPDDVKNNTTGSSSSSVNGSITINNNITNNIPSTGGSTSDNITINDDDLTSDGLIKAISHGFGYFDNIDTGEKGDGLIALISYLYGYLPQDLSYMTLFGLATVFGISIIRIITKR